MARTNLHVAAKSTDIVRAWKWSVLFGVMAAVLMAGLSAFVFINSKSFVTSYKYEELYRLGERLAEAMAPYVGMKDIPQLEITVQQAFAESDLQAVAVRGEHGNILVHMVREAETGLPISSYAPQDWRLVTDRAFDQRQVNGKMVTTRPINIGHIVLGTLDMQFAENEMNAVLSKLAYQIVIIALIMVFLWGWLIWMMSWRIYNDLRSEEKQARRRQERRLQFLERSPAANILQDSQWQITSVSQGTLDLLGYDLSELLHKDIADFLRAGSRKAFVTQRQIRDEGPVADPGTWALFKKDGTICHVRISTNDVTLDKGGELQYISHLIDLTTEEEAKNDLRKQALRDELTGIPNRRGAYSFMETLHRVSEMCVLLIDLDYFKSVNDGFGHEAGDELLKIIAQALQDLSPSTGIAARLGGEEFLIAMMWRGWDAAQIYAERVRAEIEDTVFRHQLADINRTASIGVVKIDMKTPLSEGLRVADLALLDAKTRGRNRVKLADKTFMKEHRDKGSFITEHDVMEAIEKKEILYFVQPIWNAVENRIEGFEALIRWVQNGVILPPSMFLKVFKGVVRQEKYSKLINQQRKALLQSLSDYPDQYVSFNLRIEDVSRTDTAVSWAEALIATKDHPNRKIVVELSEAAMTERLDMEFVKQKMQVLREAGILIALDDFGIEASNIDRLTSLPIDILKLDKSMFDNIVDSEKKRIAVQSLAEMAERLKIKIIAEGIETQEQCKLLVSLGIPSQQGYLHSRPVDPATLATVQIGAR